MKQKTIALVAHDNRKKDIVEWVEFNYKRLLPHKLICTGTTGTMIEAAIEEKMRQDDYSDYPLILERLKSGPLGGDQQLGALIAEGKIDCVIFLWDPMEPQPHDVDVKALLRITAVYNIPNACNRSTADFIISSPLFTTNYVPEVKDYTKYVNRFNK